MALGDFDYWDRGRPFVARTLDTSGFDYFAGNQPYRVLTHTSTAANRGGDFDYWRGSRVVVSTAPDAGTFDYFRGSRPLFGIVPATTSQTPANTIVVATFFGQSQARTRVVAEFAGVMASFPAPPNTPTACNVNYYPAHRRARCRRNCHSRSCNRI